MPHAQNPTTEIKPGPCFYYSTQKPIHQPLPNNPNHKHNSTNNYFPLSRTIETNSKINNLFTLINLEEKLRKYPPGDIS